ncbi:hypothetical protein E4U43_006624 [Claviceps pusilla]|uniref:Phospholipase/carboxylesterase/thioesterase domain-containing protein n=1 Tax=Claviceps pusilla TaxID=123648 RepID=A0A9P7NDJ7_9HYPO|nr:hypothetical protein E4U43_006624 [Claviceps pusilla]
MDNKPLPTLIVDPLAGGQHTHTVVFLHGRGDNMDKFSYSLQYTRDSKQRTLAEAFPTFRWVFPQAPCRKCASMDGYYNQWFDVWTVRDFSEREDIALEGLREVVPQIRDILAHEADVLGGRWDKVILMGISMGSATSVHTLFNLHVPTPERRLGAFVGFCGRCPFAGKSLEEMRALLGVQSCPAHNDVLRNTPMMLQHCVNDPLVKIELGRRQCEVLKSFGAAVTWCEYPDGSHWMNSPSGTDDVVRFLTEVLQLEEKK